MPGDMLLNCISSLRSLSLEDSVGPFGLLLYCVGGVRRQENVGIMWTSCMLK